MTATAEEIRSAFEAFKQYHEQELAEIKAQGSASAETKAAVERANADITKLQGDLKNLVDENTAQKALIEGLENRLNRPDVAGNSYKKFTDLQIESYAVFQSRAQGREIDPSDVDLEYIGAYRNAYHDYVKRGPKASAESIRILNEMSVGNDPGGGYWVDPDTSGRIVEFIRETTPMRRLASVTVIGSGDALEGDYDVDEAGTGGWVGETTARTGDTGTPQIWQWSIPTREQYAEPRTTQRFLDQASRSGMEDWLVRKVVRRFERDENSAFVTGTGVVGGGEVATYPAGTPATTSVDAYKVIQQVASGAAGGLTADGLVDLVFSLKSGYRQGAVLGGTRLTEAEIRKLKDGTGNYLWQPDFTERAQARVMGFPWEEMSDLPEISGGAEPIVFANFAEAYQIVDQGGIRVLRDDLTTKGRVKFYTTKYAGGDVVNFEAIKLQTISGS